MMLDVPETIAAAGGAVAGIVGMRLTWRREIRDTVRELRAENQHLAEKLAAALARIESLENERTQLQVQLLKQLMERGE